jgi:L-cysteine S-thiosulfotransferase
LVLKTLKLTLCLGAFVGIGSVLIVNIPNTWANTARFAGFQYISSELKTLQLSSSDNPALLWAKAGQLQFTQQCANCHSVDSMKSVAANYPRWSNSANKVMNLAGRINQCRIDHLQQTALPRESTQILQLESFIALQSKGQIVAGIEKNAAINKLQNLGEQIWNQQLGQLGISCAQCHDTLAGSSLAASVIPQGHANAYPIYRLQWQGVGSLERRIRSCQTGVRAVPYEYNSQELLALEVYLQERAAGMEHEGLGVRP